LALLIAWIQLIYWLYIGQAPRYLRDRIRLPSSAISHRPLFSFDQHDPFVPKERISMAFAFIGPALWNQVTLLTCFSLLV